LRAQVLCNIGAICLVYASSRDLARQKLIELITADVIADGSRSIGKMAGVVDFVMSVVGFYRSLPMCDHYHPIIMWSTVLTACIACRLRLKSKLPSLDSSPVFDLFWSFLAYGFGGSMLVDYLLFVRYI